MQKKGSTGMSETFFNYLSVNPCFPSFHRISHRPQDTVPPFTAANPPALPPYSVHSGTKAPKPQTKPSTTITPIPIKVSPRIGTAEKKKVAEVVPSKSEPSQPPPPPQPSITPCIIRIHDNGEVVKVAPKVESVPPSVSWKETEEPKTKDPTRQVVMGQGQGEVVRKAELLQLATGKGDGRKKWDVNEKITNYIERTKIKLRTGSSIGTGKSISFKGKEEGRKKLDVNEKASDYIERTKIKLRTSSSIVTGKIVSFKEKKEDGRKKWDVNEKVSDYIGRTKIKLRTSSGVGAGKSASFKVKEY